MSIRRLLLAGLASVATALTGMTLLAPTDVQAQSAARVESQTRPNFGVLLDQNLNSLPARPAAPAAAAGTAAGAMAITGLTIAPGRPVQAAKRSC